MSLAALWWRAPWWWKEETQTSQGNRTAHNTVCLRASCLLQRLLGVFSRLRDVQSAAVVRQRWRSERLLSPRLLSVRLHPRSSALCENVKMMQLRDIHPPPVFLPPAASSPDSTNTIHATNASTHGKHRPSSFSSSSCPRLHLRPPATSCFLLLKRPVRSSCCFLPPAALLGLKENFYQMKSGDSLTPPIQQETISRHAPLPLKAAEGLWTRCVS